MPAQKEQLTLNDKIKFDDKGGAILGVLEGPVADFIHPTRNGRHYSEELWENVLKNPLVQEQFKNGGIVGELDHPADRDDICTEKVAIIMPEPPVKKDGQYYGKFNILDTPCGRIVYTLAKAGFKLGVSSRGTGDVDEYTEEVDPSTYEFTCFDVVLLPAVESARMNLVTEGLDTKKVNYKKLLKEDINNSKEEVREMMRETLDHIGIKLDEDMEKKTCVICGKEFEGYGNNAQPVKDGMCCDECNQKVVIPARLKKSGLKSKKTIHVLCDAAFKKVAIMMANELAKTSNVYFSSVRKKEDYFKGDIQEDDCTVPGVEYVNLYDKSNCGLFFSNEVGINPDIVYYIGCIGDGYECTDMIRGYGLDVSQIAMIKKDAFSDENDMKVMMRVLDRVELI